MANKWWQRVFWAGNRVPVSRKRPTWRRSTLLQLETLEDRLVPSSWVVTTNTGTGNGSLPWAVTQANADTSPATITFSFTSATTITLTSTLTLSNTAQSITIDGSGGALDHHQRRRPGWSLLDQHRCYGRHRESDHHRWLDVLRRRSHLQPGHAHSAKLHAFQQFGLCRGRRRARWGFG